MAESQKIQWPAQSRPAIGGGGGISRKQLLYRVSVALGLLLLLVLAKFIVGAREVGNSSLGAVRGGRSVTANLYIGGMPSDYDLQALAESYNVRGVVNLGGPDVAEQATTAGFDQGYLRVPVAPGTAPALGQLRTLAGFMGRYGQHTDVVYIHDDSGGGRAIVTADMLLLLRGEPSAKVLQGISNADRKAMGRRQILAINQLIYALGQHRAQAGNPYNGAELDRW